MSNNTKNNPDVLAKEFLNARFRGGTDGRSKYTLRHWRNGFYEYREGHYVKVSREEMKVILSGFLVKRNEEHEEQVKLTTSLCEAIMLCIGGIEDVHLSESTKADTWVSGISSDDVQTLAFSNGLLVIYRDAEKAEFISHSPDYFTLTKLPYDYDPQAECPRWMKFLSEVTEQDSQRIEVLQQWAGYILTNDLRQHKFLLCVGEGANGKSVFFDLIERMIGRENCSHVSLPMLSDRFALCPTYGKKLNLSTESGKDIDSYAETILKALTSGDPVNYDCKYKDQFSAVPTAKMMIATNELPRFQDKSEGIWRRVLLVPFERTFSENEQNKNLIGELSEERPGIFAWALEGMYKLNRRGGFVDPDKSQVLWREYRRDVNPARTFLEENYEESAFEQVGTTDLYSHYKRWCQENGYTPMNESNFGKEVKRVFRNVKKTRTVIDGQRRNMYQDISPKGDSTDAEETDLF